MKGLTFFGQLFLLRPQHFDFVKELVPSCLFSLRDSSVLVVQHLKLKLLFALYVEQFFAFRVHRCDNELIVMAEVVFLGLERVLKLQNLRFLIVNILCE